MKIGIFDPYLDTIGGGERYILTAASCLSQEHNVVLFWNERDIVTKIKTKLGITLDNVSFQQNIFSKDISLSRRLIETRSFDRIFFLSDGSIPIVLAKKLIVHFQFPVPWVKPSSIIDRFKIKRVYRVICNSAYTKRYIDRTYGFQSRVLYPPVIIPSRMPYSKENIILSVGSLARLPNGITFKKFEFLISAFKKIIDKGMRPWRLVLIVSPMSKDKEYVNVLQKSISGYPVTILETIEHETLQDIYKSAKIYWHAAGYGEDLEKFPELAEHFGITTVEAMSYGVVPVVINAGGQKEIISNEVDGYLWDTENELIQITISLMQDVKLRDRFSNNARERARIFSQERFCQSLKRLIV